MSVTLREAAEKRAEAAEKARSEQRGDPGVFARRAPDGVTGIRDGGSHRTEVRAEPVERDGKQFLRLTGMASVYERSYEMWDMFGPYEEEVAEGAGAVSLGKNPDVAFLLNHTGIPYARSTSGTLDLSEPGGGLLSEAYLNPKRQGVQELVQAVEDGSITEMSFAFRIMDGRWSPDYTSYRISEYDIDRGDTSAVTFGANPHTSIEARAAHFNLRNSLARIIEGGAESIAPIVPPALEKLTGRSLLDARNLHAALTQGGDLSREDRATLAAVLDALAEDPARLASDQGLAAALGVRVEEPVQAQRFVPDSVDFLLQEIEAARRF